MTIRFVCPQGHALSVADTGAGKHGLCPVCKARVLVPPLAPLSEDAILELLGPRSPPEATPQTSAHRFSRSGAVGVGWSPDSAAPPKKCCENCHREISVGDHICPYCRKYIASLGDF
jgi:hypothetical protein